MAACIGSRNHVFFVLFLVHQLITMIVAVYINYLSIPDLPLYSYQAPFFGAKFPCLSSWFSCHPDPSIVDLSDPEVMDAIATSTLHVSPSVLQHWFAHSISVYVISILSVFVAFLTSFHSIAAFFDITTHFTARGWTPHQHLTTALTEANRGSVCVKRYVSQHEPLHDSLSRLSKIHELTLMYDDEDTHHDPQTSQSQQTKWTEWIWYLWNGCMMIYFNIYHFITRQSFTPLHNVWYSLHPLPLVHTHSQCAHLRVAHDDDTVGFLEQGNSVIIEEHNDGSTVINDSYRWGGKVNVSDHQELAWIGDMTRRISETLQQSTSNHLQRIVQFPIVHTIFGQRTLKIK